MSGGVHTDLESIDDDIDSEEEFTDDETDDMQLELRQICRLGDKAMLKTFLVNNPEIDLDRDGATPANMADDKDLKIVLN